MYDWSAIVSIALSCTIFEILDIENWVKGHSRSFKMEPFKSLGTVSYSHFKAIIASSLAVSEIFSDKDSVTLKSALGVVQGH